MPNVRPPPAPGTPGKISRAPPTNSQFARHLLVVLCGLLVRHRKASYAVPWRYSLTIVIILWRLMRFCSCVCPVFPQSCKPFREVKSDLRDSVEALRGTSLLPQRFSCTLCEPLSTAAPFFSSLRSLFSSSCRPTFPISPNGLEKPGLGSWGALMGASFQLLVVALDSPNAKKNRAEGSGRCFLFDFFPRGHRTHPKTHDVTHKTRGRQRFCELQTAPTSDSNNIKLSPVRTVFTTPRRCQTHFWTDI